jgi:hypothetical protein
VWCVRGFYPSKTAADLLMRSTWAPLRHVYQVSGGRKVHIHERVFTILDTTANRDFRTILGIAALLDVEPRDVADAIAGLDSEGRIRAEDTAASAADRSWRTDSTPSERPPVPEPAST